MVTAEVKKFMQNAVQVEMPLGLKQYLGLELLPRTQYKVKNGISIKQCRKWLTEQGFKYSEHKKSLYFDGHERPDVVDDRQMRFVPEINLFKKRLAEYVVGDVSKLVQKTPDNFVERTLVLLSHDEMTCQANDS
jgi:hypothetical protein